MYESPDIQRLKQCWESASSLARQRNKEAADSGTEIAREKTQYFEKLALGSGATIAALISFLGSHASRLQPRWLLRTALITLVCTMVLSLFRNWLYPFYVLNAKLTVEFEAKREEGRCKKELLQAVPALSLEDGLPIDMDEWLVQHQSDEDTLVKWISECHTTERRAWTWTIRSESAALILAITSMVLLIVLAWRNF